MMKHIGTNTHGKNNISDWNFRNYKSEIPKIVTLKSVTNIKIWKFAFYVVCKPKIFLCISEIKTKRNVNVLH